MATLLAGVLAGISCEGISGLGFMLLTLCIGLFYYVVYLHCKTTRGVGFGNYM